MAGVKRKVFGVEKMRVGKNFVMFDKQNYNDFDEDNKKNRPIIFLKCHQLIIFG